MYELTNSYKGTVEMYRKQYFTHEVNIIKQIKVYIIIFKLNIYFYQTILIIQILSILYKTATTVYTTSFWLSLLMIY